MHPQIALQYSLTILIVSSVLNNSILIRVLRWYSVRQLFNWSWRGLLTTRTLANWAERRENVLLKIRLLYFFTELLLGNVLMQAARQLGLHGHLCNEPCDVIVSNTAASPTALQKWILVEKKRIQSFQDVLHLPFFLFDHLRNKTKEHQKPNVDGFRYFCTFSIPDAFVAVLILALDQPHTQWQQQDSLNVSLLSLSLSVACTHTLSLSFVLHSIANLRSVRHIGILSLTLSLNRRGTCTCTHTHPCSHTCNNRSFSHTHTHTHTHRHLHTKNKGDCVLLFALEPESENHFEA